MESLEKKKRIEREVDIYTQKMVAYWKEKDPNFKLDMQRRKRRRKRYATKKHTDPFEEDIKRAEDIWDMTHGQISLTEYYETVELEKARWRSERFKRNLERKKRREAYLMGKEQENFLRIKRKIYEKATKKQINVSLEILTLELPENHEYKWRILTDEMLAITPKEELVEDALLAEKALLDWYFPK